MARHADCAFAHTRTPTSEGWRSCIVLQGLVLGGQARNRTTDTRIFSPNLKRVGQLIGVDVSLAAGLIKTANSPCYGLRNRAHSVHDALLMLGLDVTSRAVAAISLRQGFPSNGRLKRFWDASAQIAALSMLGVGNFSWVLAEPDPGLTAFDDACTVQQVPLDFLFLRTLAMRASPVGPWAVKRECDRE